MGACQMSLILLQLGIDIYSALTENNLCLDVVLFFHACDWFSLWLLTDHITEPCTYMITFNKQNRRANVLMNISACNIKVMFTYHIKSHSKKT